MRNKAPDEVPAPLFDSALVVRFGLMDLIDLERSTERCRRIRGYFGLSMFGDNELSVEEIARQAQQPHTVLRVYSVGRLRDGYIIDRTGKWPHLTVRLMSEHIKSELVELVGLFDEPTSNPHPIN